jgi:hypothetical protein
MTKLDEISKKVEETSSVDPNISNKVDTLLVEKKVVEQKPEPKPVEKKDLISAPKLDETMKQKILDKKIKKEKKKGAKRREKNLIKDKEFDKTSNSQLTLIYLVIIALMFLFLVPTILPNEAMYLIIILTGSFMFIPVGMLIGWVSFDIVMRCKIMRKLTRRNWGIINFVGKGNRVISKIKNFDEGLIWSQDSCWVLNRDKVCHYSKDGNLIIDEKREIDPDSVITVVETVPVVFVDMESFEPLSIGITGREKVLPSEIGNSIKAWMDNQRMKMMGMKKVDDYLMYVVIICAVACIVVSVITLQQVEALTEKINALTSGGVLP